MMLSSAVARVQATKCWILCPITGTSYTTTPFSTTISTKAVAPKLMSDNLYTYLVNHTRESDILTDLRHHTNTTVPNAARMAVSPEQGAFLSWLVKSLGVQKIIEVGVFMGYSSIAMASALPDPGGQLYALDRDPVAMETAQQYWIRSGVDHLITPYLGPAVDSLKSIIESGEKEQFDFAFIDADKRSYAGYYESTLQVYFQSIMILFVD